MQRILFLVFIFISLSVKCQIDTAKLNALSPEELLQYYINEKEPENIYKGPSKIGDSLYNTLNIQVIPTQTVYADGLYNDEFDHEDAEKNKLIDTANRVKEKLKPKIALGAGRLSYFGNVYQKKFQSPLTAHLAYDLNISQRLTRYLQLNFNVLFGELGANESTLNRHENFKSEIKAGGLNLVYDFGNFIPDRYTLRPFISLGITGFEFLSKTDLKDKYGNRYYYWTDGSIKDRAENAPDAQNAKDLKRDYTYETDVRINNQKINGKYDERSWALPVGGGAIMRVTDRVDFKLNFQLFFTNTNKIDGVTSETAIGKLRNNKFAYTSFALQYDLITNKREKLKLKKDTLSNTFWLASEKEDSDNDGVPDLLDYCLGTEKGVKVDEKGCPLDDDKDGIPNYRDDELNTALGIPVNERGVGQTDDYWLAWYNQYLNDSTGANKTTEIVGNVFDLIPKITNLRDEKDVYTVEFVRYESSIPSNELALLLSIGDIKSNTLPNGTTVVYTSGDYKKVSSAVKRRDEFKAEGNKNVGVSKKVKGKNIIQLSDGEVDELLKKENEEDLKASSSTKNTNISINTNTNTSSNTNTNTSINTKTNTSISTNTASVTKNNNVPNPEKTEKFGKEEIIYRVQLGAFRNKISTSVFNTNVDVLELKVADNFYRYVTKGFKTIENAAAVRADLVIQGFSDAFVTAYKGGKRIPLNQTKATVVDKNYKEDLSDNVMFSSVDKKLVLFKIQLGSLKKSTAEKSMDQRVKNLPNSEKQYTTNGNIRYTSGKFTKYSEAENFRKELENKGFNDGFIIATFKGKIISIQEAMELLK